MLWACHLHAMCHAQQLCITNKMTGRMSIASNSESASGRLLTKRKSHVEVINEDNPLPAKNEAGPQFRFQDLLGFRPCFNQSPEDTDVSDDVDHYIHDKSLRQRLTLISLRSGKIGLRMLTLYVFVMALGCILYVAEALHYDYNGERTNPNRTRSGIFELVLVDKHQSIWGVQLIIAALCLCYVGLSLFITTTSCAELVKTLLTANIFINFLIGVLFFITVLYPPVLRNLYVPSFLLCWPAREAITTVTIQLVQRQSQRAPNTFRAKVVNLLIWILCFSFTWVCLLHHFMRLDKRLTFFDTFWFVVVTITTVGYGDIAPSHWTTQLLVAVFILLGLVLLVPQLEELYTAFVLQRRLNNSVDYSKSHNHVIVCSTHIRPLILRDFLTEFYFDPNHYDVHIVVLVEHDLPSGLQLYLSHPVWQHRITVLIGSPLRQTDLARARAQEAIACFLHTARNKTDPDTADQHTIMSAWAIRDYAPHCKLYVQILRPKNKIFLEVADHVVCEGELKNALLAASSLCPGMATLVTLLLHTFKPEESAFTSEDYKLYNKCASCEVYNSRLGDSKYFHHFVGKNFLYAAVVAYRKYQVTLLGVGRDGKLQLNPDLHHILEDDDICYYIGFAREEYGKAGGASTVHTALWNACANIGMLSIRVAGIDPDFSEAARSSGEGGGENETASSPNEKARPFPSEAKSCSSVGSISSSEQRHGDHKDKNSHWNEARRGLQLLKFHSQMDFHANPIVKVNLPVRTPKHLDEYPVMEYGAEPTCPIDPDTQHLTFDLAQIEEGRKVSLSRDTGDVGMEPMGVDPLLQQSASDTEVEKLNQQTKESPNAKRLPLYSSGLSLISTPASSHHELPQSPDSDLLSRRPPLKRRGRSHFSKKPREEVVLELEDIEEEEELQALEDGRVPTPEVGGALEEEEGESPPSLEGEEPVPSRPRQKYNKGPPPSFPYLGFEHCDCYLLPNKRPHSEFRLNKGTDENIDEEEVVCRWPQGAVIVSCSEVWEDLYHFVTPLRACNLPADRLKPLVLLLEKEPSTEFLKFIAPLPMVYYCVGSLLCVDSWLRSGIVGADSVVVLSKPTVHLPDQHEHMVDIESIMAIRQLAKLFPHLHIVTEIHYRYNISYMRFTAQETYTMKNFTALSCRGEHLTYLFMPQFAAGRAFCSNMLDTLLYQAHTKPYIIDLLRQLLGCKQVPGSGFLWTVEMTEELLKLQTYGRLFQHLASTKRLVPLGIYRTVPVTSCPEITQNDSRPVVYDPKTSFKFLNSRLNSLGLRGETPLAKGFGYQSFVLPNPPQKTELQASDIILVLKPASSCSQAQPSSTPRPPQATDSALATDGEQAGLEKRTTAVAPLARQSPAVQERRDSRIENGDSSRTDTCTLSQLGAGSAQASEHSLQDSCSPKLAQQESQGQASPTPSIGSTGMERGRGSTGVGHDGGRDCRTVPVECHVYTDV